MQSVSELAARVTEMAERAKQVADGQAMRIRELEHEVTRLRIERDRLIDRIHQLSDAKR